MDYGSAGQKVGPYRPRGARHDQSGLWRRGLENPVLHRPYPPGRGQREDSWPPRADPENIAYERPCLRYARGAARQEVPGRGSWEAREQIGEIAELLVVERVEHIRHRRVVGAARIVLVLTQRLHQVVLTLAGQPRHLLCTGKIWVMAKIAPVLLDERPRPFEPGRIPGVLDRARRRQCGNQIGHAAQLVVGEPLRHRIHRLDGAELFSEHVELDHDVKRRLRPERGHLGLLRLAFLAMAGAARRESLL